MGPAHFDLLGSQENDRPQGWSFDHTDPIQSQNRTHRPVLRSYSDNAQHHPTSARSNTASRMNDSWIDISSQPSSSAINQRLAEDDVLPAAIQRRTPRASMQNALPTHPITALLEQEPQPEHRPTSVAGSSQDEYEESSSESDRVLSSSNEDLSNASNAEEDDTRTALGTGHHVFTPQPNAFSHPPSARMGPVSTSTPAPTSYFQPQNQTQQHTGRLPTNRMPTITRPSLQNRRHTSNIVPDHDAALRASLSTLLSCANAVRKDKEPLQMPPLQPATTEQRPRRPAGLRLVPESELNAQPTARPPSPILRAVNQQKRKSRESSKERQAKKVKNTTKPATNDELMMSPTVLSWFISAGIVLIFSAVSFGAGYAWGREAGRFEAMEMQAGPGLDAVKASRSGLGKIRLTSVMA